MRLTIPHLYDFGAERELVGDDLISPEAWDAMRATDGPFGLAETRAEWEAQSRRPELEARARDVLEIARRLRAGRVCSYGVGTGLLELCLSRVGPQVELVCTDYAPQTVERLQALFHEATVVQHDLRSDEPVPAGLHLLHRVDTELSNAALARLLARFTEPVLLVPAHLLGPRLLLREAYVRLRHRGAARAGWVRTESVFRSLWARTHEATDVQVGGTRAFLLVRRPGA